jgi:hypothetical protein
MDDYEVELLSASLTPSPPAPTESSVGVGIATCYDIAIQALPRKFFSPRRRSPPQERIAIAMIGNSMCWSFDEDPEAILRARLDQLRP